MDDLLTRDAKEVTECISEAAAQCAGPKELFIYQPCVDGHVFQDIPEMAIVKGELNAKDIICGTVNGDSWMFSRKVRDQLQDNPVTLRCTDTYIRAEDVVEGEVADRVIEYTIEHPGMLESPEGF